MIRVEDAAGNLVTTDNGRVISVARSTGTAVLQGTLTATTANGLATFANLSYNLAETITLNFTASGLTNVTSGNVVVSTGPFSKLQLLVPGESAAPGSASGKTGAPAARRGHPSRHGQRGGCSLNPVNTVSDTVGLEPVTHRHPATRYCALPLDRQPAVALNANGNFTHR